MISSYPLQEEFNCDHQGLTDSFCAKKTIGCILNNSVDHLSGEDCFSNTVLQSKAPKVMMVKATCFTKNRCNLHKDFCC